MIKVSKKQIVENLVSAGQASEVMFFLNFKEVPVSLERGLRLNLKKRGALMKVAKVRLVKIALKQFGLPESEWSEMDQIVDEQLAVVFSPKESQLVAKELCDFQKKILEKDGFVVGGLHKLALCSVDKVVAWSKLPAKDMIIQRLAFSLSYPLVALAKVLQEVANKKESN